MVTSLQGHDLVPREILVKNPYTSALFANYLPGYSVNGAYNFVVTGDNPAAALQLNKLVHSGEHEWLNEALKLLLKNFEADFPEAERPKRLAGLVNFLAEASDPDSNPNGIKTGNFIAYTNVADPTLIIVNNGKPTADVMKAKFIEMFQWDKLKETPAFNDVFNADIQLVTGPDGSKSLSYSGDGMGKADGYFSKPAVDLETHKVYIVDPDLRPDLKPWQLDASTQFINDWIAENGVNFTPKGTIVSATSNVLKRSDDAVKAILAAEIGGKTILELATKSMPSKMVVKLFDFLGSKPGGVLTAFLTVILAASAASAAQSDPLYDGDEAVSENRDFISELFGVVVGSLGGIVSGTLAGLVSFGLATVPVAIAVSVAVEKIGQQIGAFFYDTYTDVANLWAERLVPFFDGIGDAIVDLGSVIVNFVTGVFEYVSDKIVGSEGIFGLNGPLFGEDGPLHKIAAFLTDKEVLSEEGVWLWDGYDSVLNGTDEDDVLVHEGWGEANGGKGNDVLIGWNPVFIKEGEPLYSGHADPIAVEDEFLILNGGEGDDWIITILGEKAWTIGGAGRDWIFNTSAGGEIFGDTIDGLVEGVGDPLTWSEYDQLETPENSDNIWWWGNTTMWDPRKGDVLKFFGYPLVGGTNDVGYFFGRGVPVLQSEATLASLFNPIFFDYFFPSFHYYIDRENGNLLVANLFSVFFGHLTNMDELGDGTNTTGVMTFRNYDEANYSFWGADLATAAAESLATGKSDLLGDMSMLFKYANPALALFAMLPGFPGGLNAAMPLIDDMLTRLAAVMLQSKAIGWSNGTDPLILDLDGDGIETISIDKADVWFDLDNDLFGEKTGWLSGDDGFLVRDLDGDGRIENVAEMFGGPGLSGLAVLAAFDANGDGKIDVADLIWSELKVWRDRDGDGVTDEGELVTLDALGIVSLSLNGTHLGVTTPQGTLLDRVAEFTWSNGSVGRMFDAIFEINDVDSHFGGDAGVASWLGEALIGARGFGEVADLEIAMSNDFDLAQLVESAAASMTTPDILDMRLKAGAALGQWGYTLEETRELASVLLSADGKALIDRAIWVEDASGGFWQRASGNAVLAADGAVIERPSLEQVLAQTGGTWQVEQVFSPSTRAEAVQHRTEAPYLVQVVNGRAVVLDFGVQNGDGSWRLASGNPILNAEGTVIAAPTVADILAQAPAAGREWRQEEIGHNPLAGLDVAQIGVRQQDGIVTNYTVQITDDEGSFYVWASNLDDALAVQYKDGDYFGYLRGKAVNFGTLDIVNSDEDSGERVELLTPGQFNFALQLSGITFDPAMLAGTYDNTTGVIDYSVNATGDISLSDDKYVSGIKAMIELLDPVMDQYITVSRAFALRMAFQGGLAEYFPGIAYDAAKDQFHATTDRELAPMFIEIFRDAPGGEVPATLYLQKWQQILSVMYPDYSIDGSGNMFSQTLSLDSRFIAQMMLPAYQTIGIDLDLTAAMIALGVNLGQDHDRLKLTPESTTTNDGSASVDFFVVGDGAQLYRGGMGGDVYFVGQSFGNVTIEDVDRGAADELRFTNVTSSQVIATRVGQDLILKAQGQTGQITVKNHFLGELNPSFGNVTEDTALKAIIFADGVLWDQFRIAFEVSDPKDTNDVIVGSGALDVLDGGKGNDVLQGGTGGDIYVFRFGDGQDIVEENNSRPTMPGKGGLDFLQFMGEITADDLRLTRAGESDDLLIQLMNKDGALTGDTILVKDQFGGMRFNLGAFLGGIDASLALDYIAPNMIEKFLFEDGSWLDFGQISQRVLENAATSGSDLIYGFIDADTITGAAGDDLLVGREGGDTYLFGRGDGVDEIEDGDMSPKLFGSPDDVLTFEDGIKWGDLEFLRTGGSDTLSLRIAGTTDTVILSEQERSQPFIGFINLIEKINFGGGISWTYGQLFQHFVNLAQTTGDDTIYGFHTSDVMQGGLGDDRMEGRGGSDRYVWTVGDGVDTILDTSGDSDEVQFGNLASTDVDVLRNGTSLIFRVKTTGETLTIEDQYARANKQGRAIEAFVFTDRTVMFTQVNPEDIDVVGTAASEWLIGSQFGETLDGKAGDDTLEGGSDGDTYLFDAGYGSDVIIDRQERASWVGRHGTEREDTDRVIFGQGLSFATAVFTPVGNDLVITFTNRPDVLTIRNQFRSISDEVESFVFTDRTISSAGIEELLAITGGNRGDNNLVGSATAPNALDGRQGFDTLTGGTAADSYAFGIGYDFDRIVEKADAANVLDRVVFGEGVTADQLILRRDGLDLLIDLGNAEDVLRIVSGLGTTTVERFSFADGTEMTLADIRAQMLVGTDGNDRLEGFANSADRLIGGAGSDEMIGGTGNDTYVFGHGDGQDSVLETGTGTANAADRIEFKTGVTRDQVTFETVGADLVIRLAPGNDSLVILGGADATAGTTVEQFAFADGTVLTMADVQTLMFATRGNGTSDYVDGSTVATGLSLKPGAGFDAVALTAGSTYIFAKGDGLDRVTLSTSYNKTNAIVIEDYTSAEVEVRRTKINGSDVMITFPATGEAIYVVGALSNSGSKLEITFADGVVWTQDELVQASIDGQISEGDDRVIGPLSLAAIYEGGKGNDEFDSDQGIDAWVFNRGDGRDLIVDSGGVNEVLTIRGYTAADMRVHSTLDATYTELVISFVGTDDEIVLRSTRVASLGWVGVDIIQFSDGPSLLVTDLLAAASISAGDSDDRIVDGGTSNTLTGGKGDDTLVGNQGTDTYVYSRGDGIDYIDDASGSLFRLKGYIPSEVQLVQQPGFAGLVLRLVDGGEIWTKLANTFASITFDNGTVWLQSDFANLIASAAPQGSLVNGTAVADTLDSGLGHDSLVGGAGDDTYLYARGDGSDVIYEANRSGTEPNTLRLVGIDPAEVILRAGAGTNLNVVIPPSTADGNDGGYIAVIGGLTGASNLGIGRILFDDGTIWHSANFASMVAAMRVTDGSDYLTGSSGADTLAGGKGDDYLLGGGGNDTYRYVRGDGYDQISDDLGTDVLEIAGYDRSEVTFDRRGASGRDLVIHLGSAGDTIVITGAFINSSSAVETIVFTDMSGADRTVNFAVLKAEMQLAMVTNGDDVLSGSNSADTMQGGRGNDLLDGGVGSDTYLYATGDGDDRISDSGASGVDRLVLDINPNQVTYALRYGPTSNDLVLRLSGPNDRIILTDTLGTDIEGGEEIQFADGTIWTRAIMREKALQFAQTTGDDAIWGFAGAETYDMGEGNDTVMGGLGNDTFVVQRGDGQDRITETAATGSLDVVTFLDYVSSEVSVERLFKGSPSIQFSFLTSGDTLIVDNLLASDGSGVERFTFSDGVTWTAADILQRLDNTAPVASADGYFSVISDQTLTLTTAQLLRNDFDPDGDAILVVRVDGGSDGMAEIDANGNILFQANQGFSGATQLSYTISDGRGGFDTGLVDIRVRPVAQAVDDAGFTVAEDGSLQIRAEQLLANDADGDRMIIGQVTNAVGGTAVLSSTGNITFVAAANFTGLAQFTYVANTPEGGVAQAVVRINVTPVNDAPTATTDGPFALNENSAITLSVAQLLANDTDIDSPTATLEVIAVEGTPDVSVELTAMGDVLVTPRADFFGAGYFTYTLRDASGATSIGRVNLTVNPVNQAPILGADTFDTAEDTPIFVTFADLLGNDSDPDGNTLTIERVQSSVGGRATIQENGVSFVPNGDFHGSTGFRYFVSDGQGAETSVFVTINVASVNDAPDAKTDSYTMPGRHYLSGLEDQPIIISIADLMLNDSDVDDDALTFQTASNAVGGTISLPGDGTIVFTPDADFWGEATFSYVVADAYGGVGAAEVRMFFANVEDGAPVAVTDVLTIEEDKATEIPLSVLLGNDYDIDRDDLIFVDFGSTFATSHGTLDWTDTNKTKLKFTPGENDTRSTEFFYTITDDHSAPVRGRIVFNMVPLNDQPIAGDDSGFVTERGVPLVLRISDLMANDIDVELTALTFAGVEAHSAGTVEIVNDQFIVLHFATDFTGEVTLDYLVTDGSMTDTARVTAFVGSTYDGSIEGSALVDLLIGTGGADSIYGLAGNDIIRAEDGDDVIFGGDGGEMIFGGSGTDRVDYSASDNGVRVSLATRFGQGGDAQGDELFSIEALTGSNFGDTLDGGFGDNALDGGAGNDLLSGLAGADTLVGGSGDDTLQGGEGADQIDGGSGSDTADYSTSAEAVAISLLAGTASGGDAAGDVLTSIENLIGSDLADILEGDGGANHLSGGRGADTLLGGSGDDVLTGGRGADVISGGDGIDTADYSLSDAGVVVNMADGAAGGGDAAGDVFTSIEIVQGSYHDDALTGDSGDNRLRGGVGADTLDGGAGFDTADYTTATSAVAVDLGTGQGTAGEALGDQLTQIEKLLGSAWNDSLTGGGADDTFDGGLGDDVLAGGGGSDTYLFGFGAGSDVLTEADVAGFDRVVLQAPVLRSDVSLVREGDDLLIELENTGGFLTDTLRITGHFSGALSGIEEIAFAEGLVWDRDAIDDMARLGRLNAADDIWLFGTEDEVAVLDPALLLANDASEGVADLELVSVAGENGATASIDANGMIRFQGPQDANGDAFFTYTIRDAFGRESTARVEVNLAAVNDAPTVNSDGPIEGVEDQILIINFAQLLANDTDIDGDSLTIIALEPLLGLDGEPLYSGGQWTLTHGRGQISGTEIRFEPRTDHFGLAGFRYLVSDGHGGTAYGEVHLTFVGVNDGPRGDDQLTVRLDMVNTILLSDLMANDVDPEGDDFWFDGLFQGINCTVTLVDTPQGRAIEVVAHSLQDASFGYYLEDSHEVVGSVTVNLNVRPLNDPPTARNDRGFETLEDDTLIIDPDSLLANDTDQNGDPLTITALDQFALNGRVEWTADGMIAFIPRANFNGTAGFEYTISDGRGGFDTAWVSLTIEPRNDAPVALPDLLSAVEDQQLLILRGELTGNDFDPEGDGLVLHSVSFEGVAQWDEQAETRPANASLAADVSRLDAIDTANLTLADGAALPSWLAFDAQTMTLTGTAPDDFVGALNLSLLLTLPAGLGGQSLTQTFTFAADQLGTLSAGLALELPYILMESQPRSLFAELEEAEAFGEMPSGEIYSPAVHGYPDGTWTATDPSGRALADWLVFDTGTKTLSIRPDAVPPGAGVAEVRIAYTPVIPYLSDDVVDTPNGGFAFDVVINPATGIDPAINQMLQTQAFFAAQGLFALPLADRSGLTATLETGAPLPSWISFDPETLAFTGTAPAGDYVGALVVRIALPEGDGRPAMDLITEITVDPVLHQSNGASGFSAVLTPEGILVTTPEDFDGTYILSYTIADPSGAVSEQPGRIVVNVVDMRDLPDAVADEIVLGSAEFIDIPLSRLLSNDRDLDGDAIRITNISPAGLGTLTVVNTVVLDAAAQSGLAASGAVYSAQIVGGAPLPDWISIDPVSGQLTAQVPLDARGAVEIELIRLLDGITTTATLSPEFNGNVGAVLRYIAAPGDAASDSFTYTLTDDLDGSVTAQVTLVLNRAPKLVNDVIAGVEDTDLVLPVSAVLDNDRDLDGDPMTITSVGNAENGNVSLLNGIITFTPTANFDGVAGFDYTVSDGRGGVSVAHVQINVASTNRAPVAGTDSFTTDEDTGFVFTEQQLMSNDSDADLDALTFVGFDPNPDFNLSQQPDGSWMAMPGANLNGTFTLTYRITDGRLETTGSIQVTVAPVNDAPILGGDQIILAEEDTPLVIDMSALLANDIDPEGDGFTVVEVYDPLNGTVSMVDGVVTFTPLADYHGPAGFLYVIRDSNGAEVTATAEIMVAPAAFAPIPVLDRMTMDEDGSLLIDPSLLLANDYNPEAGDLVFLGFTSAGVTAEANGLYRYIPPANFNGVVALTYQVTNASGVVVDGQLQVTVAPVNDAPVAGADTIAMIEDQILVVTAASLLANDSDPDIQSFAILSVADAVGVDVVLLPNGDIQITPDLNRTANGSFTYTVRDSLGLTSQGSVTVTLSPVNDAPLLAAPLSDRLATEDMAFSIALQTGVFSDPDGDTLTYSLTLADGSPLPEWLMFNPLTQVMSGTPPANLFGDVMLRLSVSDGSLSISDDFALRLQGTNDAPVLVRPVVDVALDATGQIIRVGQAFSFAADLAAFADPDGTPLGFGAQLASGAPLPTWLSFNGTTFSGTPPAGSNGTLDIRLRANDGGTVVSDVFTLIIESAIALPYDSVFNAPTAGGSVTGTAGRDQINGGAGKDTLYDLAGNDDVYGGAGDDTFYAGAGADLYDGGAGVDKLTYQSSTAGLTVDMITPTSGTGIAQGDRFVGIEWLYGSNFNDVLITTGLSRIDGMGGDDFIRDSAGAQMIWGGSGRDWFQFVAGDPSQDRIADFQIGQDIIDLSLWGVTSLSQLTFSQRMTGSGPANDLIISYMSDSIRVDGYGTASIPQFNAGSFYFMDATQTNLNQWAGAIIDGTSAADKIDMQFRDAEGQGISGGGQVIQAGAGADIIHDGSGNDQVYGGDGDDMFYAGLGSDVYYGGLGHNQLSYADARSGVLLDMGTPANNQGAAAGDTWSDIDYVHGSDYSDVILAEGVTRVFGRAGDDYIRDGAGAQMLIGGDGADTFAMIAGDGNIDRVADFQLGQDKLDLSAWGVTSIDQLLFSERVSGQGGLMGDLMIRFGNEQVRLDGLTTSTISQFTAASFVFATPAPVAAYTTTSDGSANRVADNTATVESMPTPEVTAQTPLQATLALAASTGDALNFIPAVSISNLGLNSSAQLSSQIAGDALSPVGQADQAPLAADGPVGTLVDPETSVTAFLSPTQLAAMDGDQLSIY